MLWAAKHMIDSCNSYALLAHAFIGILPRLMGGVENKTATRRENGL